jgi:hypothetical protein
MPDEKPHVETREEARERRRKYFERAAKDMESGVLRIDLSLPHRQRDLARGKALFLRELTQIPLGQVDGPKREPEASPDSETESPPTK